MLKNFKCKRCGSCCYSPRLYKKDVERIKKLGFKKDFFVEKDFRGFRYIKEKNGWCMFLIKGKKAACRIYPERPKICRLYPSRLINGSCKPEKLVSDKLFEK